MGGVGLQEKMGLKKEEGGARSGVNIQGWTTTINTAGKSKQTIYMSSSTVEKG